MRFVIAGASGFLGKAWTAHLTAQGHDVVHLVRRRAGSDESSWDPYAGKVDLDLIGSADVVANLAGAPLAHFPWTRRYRETFRQSRLQTTATLARAVAQTGKASVFVAQNGVAGYGDQGDRVVTEGSPTDADTFLGQVTRDWQAAAQEAAAGPARVVVLRSAVVLDHSGGALKAMLLPFKLGVGGRIGSGEQYFSTISLTDWLRAATWLADTTSATGAYNLAASEPRTNAEFTKALGEQLHRPTVMPLPSFAVKAALGPVAPELLGSIRVAPKRLLDEGFTFEHPTLEQQLSDALG